MKRFYKATLPDVYTSTYTGAASFRSQCPRRTNASRVPQLTSPRIDCPQTPE